MAKSFGSSAMPKDTASLHAARNRVSYGRITDKPNMVTARMAAFAVSVMVAIPAFEFARNSMDSSIAALMAVSLLLISLLGMMRCLLDPCSP
ncbi:hypothetical protein [Allopontixanthobacter sp.]|uniref:hypothetical protein n=1 Tax=Allopontixanthobacter sp. TaxID=2906452 RepID=UPI002AB98E5C|nr:hypothetical protein [Allopontixanthobacter sp.]MDZ4307023.1 hypothetical protein [Allopontixanthobacter sp.]